MVDFAQFIQPAAVPVLGHEMQPGIHVSSRVFLDSRLEQHNWVDSWRWHKTVRPRCWCGLFLCDVCGRRLWRRIVLVVRCLDNEAAGHLWLGCGARRRWRFCSNGGTVHTDRFGIVVSSIVLVIAAHVLDMAGVVRVIGIGLVLLLSRLLLVLLWYCRIASLP